MNHSRPQLSAMFADAPQDADLGVIQIAPRFISWSSWEGESAARSPQKTIGTVVAGAFLRK